MDRRARERPIDILLVEDNPGDVRLVREGFREARVTNDLHDIGRGEDALEYLHQRGAYADAPRPDVVLLDMSLPDMDGTEVLSQIKGTPELKTIPVIVLTSSRAEEDIVKSYELHANAYLLKPVDADEFIDLARTLGNFWVQMIELPPE